MSKAISRAVTHRRIGLLFIGIAILLAVAHGASAQVSSNPSKIMDQYRSQRVQWTTNIWPYANTLFGLLAVIEFAWSAAVMLLEKADLQSWTSALVRKIMWIGCFYALLLNGRIWIPWIIQSFEQIGETSSGVAALSPSGVFSQGLNIAGALMDSASTSAFFTKPGSSLALVFAALIIVLSYGIITLQFIVAMVESYIIVAAGFIFVGFGGSRWTVPYTERYIGLAVSTGVKIMLLYLLIGAGFNFALDWATAATTVASSPSPVMSAFDIMGAAVIFMMLCWQIPKLFAAVLGGSPALTGGDLIATGTALMAGAATVGSLGAASVAAAAGGAAAASGGAGTGGGASGTIAGTAGGVMPAGRSGGGGVPPPSSPPPSPSANGGPKQPNPPNLGTGGSAPAPAMVNSSDSTGNSSGSNGISAATRNKSGSASPQSALSAVGGDGLSGSGFESERPASGFAPHSVRIPAHSGQLPLWPASSSNVVGATGDHGMSSDAPSADIDGLSSVPNAGSEVQSVSSARPARSDSATGGTFASRARRTQRTFSSAADRLRGARRQWGMLPSDAAPHTPPPRMPIEHGE